MDGTMNDQRAQSATDTAVEERVRECLRNFYGLEGRLQRLPGENLNFLVTVASDPNTHIERYVFKIVDEHMPPEVVELELAAMEHAATGGFEPRLPRTYKNKNGNYETRIKLPINAGSEKDFRSRIIEFLHGTDLSSKTDISINLLENVGETVAMFARAVRDFDHPAARRNHRWNLAESLQHVDKIRFIEAPEKRELAVRAFERFRSFQPRLADLPWQFIHGDAYDENLLVEGDRVVGLVDFGDCCRNPTVCDLAICLAYLMNRGEDPLANARAVLRGYTAVRSLTAAEREALYPLVGARVAVSLCVANARKRIDPLNPNWFGGEARTWEWLKRLDALGQEAFLRGLNAET